MTVVGGLDPYRLGPAAALGVGHPLVRSIPTMWRDTPSPYGPLSVLLERGVAALAGDDVVLGIVAHRVLALAGIGAVVWALPRLAARCGVTGERALWLGAAHPLVLFHVVSGAHNDSLMIGSALVGLELGLAAGPRLSSPSLLGGATLVACGAAVKLPALLLLGFLGASCARARGGSARAVVAVAAVLAVVAAAAMSTWAWLVPDGWGWVTTAAGVPGSAITWTSPVTDLGLLTALVGSLGGLGEHAAAVLALTRTTGLLVAACCCGALLVATLRGRRDPVTAAALAMAAVVLLGPVVQPWYLLWICVPLAATRVRLRWPAAGAVTAILAVPSGADFLFHAYQAPLAVAGASVVVAASISLACWRPGAGAGRTRRAPPPAAAVHLDRRGARTLRACHSVISADQRPGL